MHLPNYESAYVPIAKIVGYLISESHPIGKSKAKFFRSLGFDESNTDLFVQELLKIACSYEVAKTLTSTHGTKYVIIGELDTPISPPVTILTVWIIDTGAKAPRFITARPFNPNREVDRD